MMAAIILKRKSKIVKYADERDSSCSEIDVPGHASALLLTAYPEIGSKLV
jgi:N-acetyl-beta-hexosaminidase